MSKPAALPVYGPNTEGEWSRAGYVATSALLSVVAFPDPKGSGMWVVAGILSNGGSTFLSAPMGDRRRVGMAVDAISDVLWDTEDLVKTVSEKLVLDLAEPNPKLH